MTPDGFERVTLIGPGLIGGSLGLALKARGLAGTVRGVGRRQVSMDKALAAGAVDEATLDAEAGVAGADLVVLCTSVGRIRRQLRELVPHMKAGALVTDVGSVKGAICATAAETLAVHGKPGMRFVGGHPLAGSERRGVDAAHGDLFVGATCILTPSEETDPGGDGLQAVRAMWEGVGAVAATFSPQVHDALLAQISHLPHVAAAALVNAASDEALPLAATGFRDTTRIASGDPGLWVDICLANRRAMLEALERLDAELEGFRSAVDAGDAETLARLFTAAKRRRDARYGETQDATE
jgi:prephenate dehydrogenase